MIWIFTGTISFVFMIAFDYRKCRGIKQGAGGFNPWFIVGMVLLIISWTALMINADPKVGPLLWIGLGLLAMGVIFYGYVLTITIDKRDYTKDSGRSQVSRKGFYAKVRHPGVWCFLGCVVGTGVATPEAFWPVLWFAVLNLAYVWLQDKYFFPVYLEGYEEYKKDTRFI